MDLTRVSEHTKLVKRTQTKPKRATLNQGQRKHRKRSVLSGLSTLRSPQVYYSPDSSSLTAKKVSRFCRFNVTQSHWFGSYVQTLTINKLKIDAMKPWLGISDPLTLVTIWQQHCLSQLFQFHKLWTFEMGFSVAELSEVNGNMSRLLGSADNVFNSSVKCTLNQLQRLHITNPPNFT